MNKKGLLMNQSIAPVASAVFSYNAENTLISESGVPAAFSTTHARIYVDLTSSHCTGLALANLNNASSVFTFQAFQADGTTRIGDRAELQKPANGHIGAFADQLISGLPPDFAGVLDITVATPFAALTLRSLTNERGDFLITTFPVADATRPAPSPVVFPHIADGGGYTTQIIQLSPGGAANTSLLLYDDSGAPFEATP
jgi:hypothetical protein